MSFFFIDVVRENEWLGSWIEPVCLNYVLSCLKDEKKVPPFSFPIILLHCKHTTCQRILGMIGKLLQMLV